MKNISEAGAFNSQDVPLIPQGLGTDTVWFGGGRVGASVAAHGGIERILYYGRQSMGRSPFFGVDTRSAYAKLFKLYLLIGDKAYNLTLNQTLIYPGGYKSHFSVPEEGIELEHSLVLVTDAVLQTVRVIRNRGKKALRLRIAWHESTRVNREGRTWGKWDDKLAPNTWAVRISDQIPKEREGITWFGVVSEKPLITHLTHSGRRFFESTAFKDGAVTVTALFGYDKAAFVRRATSLKKNGSKENAATIAGWDKRVTEVPKLELGNPSVQSFFRLSPLLLESVMPNDLPGGMRAAARDYWVWGWDTLVHCDAYLAAGQEGFLKDALELYHRTAHPTKGVGHQFDIDMNLRIPQAPAAQGLYTYALYQYVSFTGDTKVLKKHYPLVLTILKLATAKKHKTGLFPGHALFPDHPQYAGHNGHDISVFNNSIFYQAARVTEHLAGWMNDPKTAKLARESWQKLKTAFDLFWDAKQGFWFDSLDSRDLTPRRSYPSHAILSFSPFARELFLGREKAASQFMAKHLVFSGGIRMYPLWDSSFNGDGNQFGQHYPVGSDLLLLKTSAIEGRQEILEQWLGWVKDLWDQQTVPEGVTVEAENDGPLRPDSPGGKQPFSSKAWYLALLNAYLGVHFDAGGVTVDPGFDRSVKVDGIYYAGQRWNVLTKGKGKFVQKILVNGVEVLGTCKIPADVSPRETMTVEITRGPNPGARPQLLAADGALVTQWQSEAKSFSVHLNFPGPVELRYSSPRKPQVLWNGKAIPTSYNARTGQGQVLLASNDFLPDSGDLTLES